MLTESQKDIVRRMLLSGYVGGKHTAVEQLRRGVRSNRKGGIDDDVKELTKMGFILPKPTHYGLQVSLNPRMLAEIKRELTG
jgi:hypothetical protein